MTETPKSALTFPCDFPIKIFGLASDEFEIEVLTIIKKHIKELPETALKHRASKEGKYLAITVTVPVESQEQLDDIYRALTSSSHVLMAL